MEVYQCFCHELPYSHVCHQITARRYGSSDRRWLRCPSAFSDGSLCFVPFSLYCFGLISGIFTYEQFPFKSHTVLPFLDLFTVDGLYCAT